MRTLPLYNPAPADSDGWHAVRAPGGYEWWYFDAEDPTGRIQIVAIFLEGFIFHPGYLRAHARFVRRPTRHRPPVAGDFPCGYFVVYEDGKILSQFMTQVPPEAFSASPDRPDVTLGANRLTRDTDGTLRLRLAGTPWRVTFQGPSAMLARSLRPI